MIVMFLRGTIGVTDSKHDNICPAWVRHRAIELIEKPVEQELPLSEMAVETKMRSLKLYAILSSLLRFKPKNLFKQVTDKNGFEVWRQLLRIFSPRTKARSIASVSS